MSCNSLTVVTDIHSIGTGTLFTWPSAVITFTPSIFTSNITGIELVQF